MADFLLSVGVDVGLSYDQMQKDISGLVSKLNSNPPKVKIGLEIDSAAISNFRNQIADLNKSINGTKSVAVGVNGINGARAASDMASVAKNTRDAANASRTMNSEIKNTSADVKMLKASTTEYYTALKQVNTLLSQVTHSQERWTAAKTGKSSAAYSDLGDYANDLRSLQQQLQSGTITTDEFKNRMASIRSGVTSATGVIKAAGEATQSWSDRVGTLSAKFGAWLSITQVIMAGVRAIKAMTGNVIELNSAMTELKKVTDETDATYERFLNNAGTRAKKYGASLSDTVTASADFARLGYNIEDAEKLADSAIVYKNVGDGIEDIGAASESIIATMQAFGVSADDVMSIVDKFNEVGNNYAISSKGVGDALLRSAAAMHAANNSLDETIALATAANTVVQDPDKVGTTLKTVSMFLRAAKTEAEDAGESTEGMATSVSKLRDEILALTGNKVDIQIDDNTFKSTYQILKELSSVWNELTDITQANILERIGGKRNSNVVAALLENFSVAENALKTSSESAGSAVAENEKVLESLQGKLNILKATFQELSQSFISDDFLGGAITGLTKLLDVINMLISVAGPLPTTIGAITLALSAFGKNIGVFSLSGNKLQIFGKSIKQIVSEFNSLRQINLGAGINSIFSSTESNQSLIALQNFSRAIDSGMPKVQAYKQHIAGMDAETRKAALSIASGSKSVSELGNKLQTSGVKAKIAAVGVTALNVAMNMLISMGISAAIQGIITGLDHLIHYEERAAEKSKELAQNSREAAQTQAEQTENLSSLIDKYQEIASSENQDSSTREEILNIQNQIVSLVGDQASGLDLVNGKLDEQLTKLQAIKNHEDGQTVADYRKAYIDSADSAKKSVHHNGNWAGDMFEGKNSITFDFWGESNERSKGLELIDSLWKEKGYGRAYVDEVQYDLLGLAWDSYSKLEFEENLSIQDRIKALDEAIDVLEKDKDIDYTNTKLWGNLVDIRAELYGKDSEYSKQVQTASDFLNKLTQNQIGEGSDINTYEDYVAYRQELIDKIAGDTTIKQAIQDGALSNDQVTSVIDGYLGTLEKYGVYYEQWQKSLAFNIDEVSSKIKQAFGASDTVQNSSWSIAEKQIQDFNSWVDNLSDEDKEIAYDISVTTDTATWTLEDWRNQLSNLKDDTNALDVLKAKMDAINDVKAGKIQFDISGETSGVEELQSAIQSSISATGLTADLISQVTERYSVLAGFNPAELFEKTANGIHLNADALRELESEYKAVNETYLNTALEEQVDKYNELTEQISKCSDIQERSKLISEQNQLGSQIEQTALLAAQYDGLTSAYQQWINAQSAGEEGDMYDNIADNIKNIKELYDKGLVGTNEFRTAVQMMTNFDISNWGIEDIMKAYENGYPLMIRYFTDGQEGCRRFLSDISNLNSEWAHMNEDGSWEISFGTGNDQEIADKLGISVDAVQAIMRKLSDYGFEINLDSIFSELGLAEDKLVSTNEKLKEIGKTDVDFNFNTTTVEDAETEIKKAQSLWDSFKNDDGTFNINAEGGQEAYIIISNLLRKKLELESSPVIMSVDASKVTDEVGNAIGLLQQFHTAQQELQVQQQIGVDTTEAQGKIQDIATKIQGLSDDTKAKLGINTEEVDKALANISQTKIDVPAGVNLDPNATVTIETAIAGITPEVMVKAGVNPALVDEYCATEKEGKGTVKWGNDTLLVDEYSSVLKTATGTVTWGNNTDNVKTTFTGTGLINWSGGGGARGTAFSSGSWGAKKSGIALGGELGQELVVRDGRFFTIGDYGAEFFRYKKDDIIFNAEQTKQIFEKGKITSGNRRGNALAEGTAFSGGSGRFYQSGKPITSKYVGSSSSPSSSSSTSSSKSDTKSSSKEELEFERLYKYHQHLLNMEQESLADYLNWLVDAYKQAYEAGEIELDDFYKYEEEVYSKSKDLFDDYLNDISHQIEMLEHQGIHTDDIVAMYREMQESVHQQAEYYRSLGLDDNSDTIQELQKQWWEYYDNIKDKIIECYEDIISHSENLIEFNQIWLDNAISDGDYGKIKEYSSTIIAEYKKMQDVVHQQAEYYRSLGYSDTSKEVAELSKLWWEYRDNIIEAASSGFQEMVDNTRDALDEIQNLYSTLQDAADEFADRGSLTVDSFKAIAEYGLEYLNYLKDENGMLVINKERIESLIAARTHQLAVDTALNYVEQIRFALMENDIDKVNELAFGYDNASNSTWGLVYANLALLDLNGDQYKAALDNVNKLKDLADNAIKDIGIDSSLSSANDSLESIIDLVMELIKYETEEHIEALEDQIDRYKKIIDLKKESLQATKEENDYNKEVASKINEIAKLQSRINQLSLDDSRSAQAEKKSLEEELAQLQGELSDYQADHALDKQLESLDDMSEAYEEEKNKEIETARESIRSTEKLYRLAVERITTAWENDWDGLFQDIINWNYDAGSSIENEIVSKWDKATESLKKYGLTLDAINGKMSGSKSADDSDNVIVSNSNKHPDIKPITEQMKANSTEWMTADPSRQRELHQENQKLANQLEEITGEKVVPYNGLWYWNSKDGEELYSIKEKDAVPKLIAAMKRNSNQWSSASASKKTELEERNNSMARHIEQFSGKRVYKDDNGVWWIDDKELYEYHKGGVAGNNHSLKDSEILACLEKGELVLDNQKKDALYEYIDISTYILERFGATIDRISSLISASSLPADSAINTLSKEVTSGVSGIKEQNSSCVIEKIEVTAPIQVSEKLDKDDIIKHSQTIGAISADYVKEGFTKKGIKPTMKRL